MEARQIELAPLVEVIGVGKVMDCPECNGSGIDDVQPHSPCSTERPCYICGGKKRFPQFVEFDSRYVQ